MAYTKSKILDQTIEIVKAYVQGSGTILPQVVLKEVYEQIKNLNADTEVE